MTPNSEKYIAHETKMQKFRILTPMASFANLFSNIGGFAILGAVAWHWVSGIEVNIQNISDKSDSHYQKIYNKINDVGSSERIDVKCLDNNFAKCGACRAYEVC